MRRRVVRAGDDAVIEGFPRSANSFASVAFELSQPAGIRFGNHFHSPAQFMLAKRYGVPAMLVLREPISAVKSYLLHSPVISPCEAFERYLAFHRALLSITDSFVVAPFEEVTTDFSKSIRRLNERFERNFNEFDHTAENVERVFQTILKRRKIRIGEGIVEDNPLAVTVPSEEKRRHSETVEQLLENEALADLKCRALQVYHKLRDPGAA